MWVVKHYLRKGRCVSSKTRYGSSAGAEVVCYYYDWRMRPPEKGRSNHLYHLGATHSKEHVRGLHTTDPAAEMCCFRLERRGTSVSNIWVLLQWFGLSQLLFHDSRGIQGQRLKGSCHAGFMHWLGCCSPKKGCYGDVFKINYCLSSRCT